MSCTFLSWLNAAVCIFSKFTSLGVHAFSAEDLELLFVKREQGERALAVLVVNLINFLMLSLFLFACGRYVSVWS